jgi:hypothetical protein
MSVSREQAVLHWRRPRCPLYSSAAVNAGGYVETDLKVNKLADNVPKLTDKNGHVHIAKFFDPNLLNPWGVAESAASPFWVSDNNAGKASLYNTQGAPQSLVVSIPAPGGPLGREWDADRHRLQAAGNSIRRRTRARGRQCIRGLGRGRSPPINISPRSCDYLRCPTSVSAFLRGPCCASDKLADVLAKGRSLKRCDLSTIHPQQGRLVRADHIFRGAPFFGSLLRHGAPLPLPVLSANVSD